MSLRVSTWRRPQRKPEASAPKEPVFPGKSAPLVHFPKESIARRAALNSQADCIVSAPRLPASVPSDGDDPRQNRGRIGSANSGNSRRRRRSLGPCAIANRAHTPRFRAILRDVRYPSDWMVDDAVRCVLLSASTCQPVDTHTAVDKRRLTASRLAAAIAVFKLCYRSSFYLAAPARWRLDNNRYR